MRWNRWMAPLLAVLATCGPMAPATADDFPSKPIRVLVGFSPGTATDLVARMISERLAKDKGWSVIVENKAGQAGSTAVNQVWKSPPDGYTLLISANGPLAANPNLYSNIKYDATRDFTPITKVAILPYVVAVNAKSDYKTLNDLLAAARGKPGGLNYGTLGVGSTSHLITETMSKQAGITMTHVPYKGSSEVFTGMMSGSLDVLIDTSFVTVPQVRDGRLRALAVTTAKPIDSLPGIPTLIENGIPVEMGAWLGIVGPAGIDPAIQATLNTEFRKVLESPEIREKLATTGSIAAPSTVDEFAAFIKAEVVKWGNAVRESGAKAE